MADNTIKLTDENAARGDEATQVASKTGTTAGAIFERRDPVRDSCDAAADRRGALDRL